MEGNFVWRSARLHSRGRYLCIFMCDLFLLTNNIDISSYADDNTPHAMSSKQIWLLKGLNSFLTVFLHSFKIIE